MARRGEGNRVFVIGAGKLGTAIARAMRARGLRVTLRAARAGLPRAIDADVVVVAVRDRDVAPLAEKMRDARVVPKSAVVVHVAGALGADALSALRGSCAGVAQMHPMIAFASKRAPSPRLEGGHAHVAGDGKAVSRARRLARTLGMTPRTFPALDTVAYHAAAGLVANGAAALAALGAELLVRAGVPRDVAPQMLGPLLRSVADNVAALGFPEALTGPVRRGDAVGLEKHLATLRAKLPASVTLYLASAEAQLPLARAIGDAAPESFEAIARVIAEWNRTAGGGS